MHINNKLYCLTFFLYNIKCLYTTTNFKFQIESSISGPLNPDDFQTKNTHFRKRTNTNFLFLRKRKLPVNVCFCQLFIQGITYETTNHVQ